MKLSFTPFTQSPSTVVHLPGSTVFLPPRFFDLRNIKKANVGALYGNIGGCGGGGQPCQPHNNRVAADGI